MKVCSLIKWGLFETTEQLMLKDMDTGRLYVIGLVNSPSWQPPHNQVHCRYCELNSRPDPTRGASWNKIASVLLVVQCSQYVMALDSGREQGALPEAGLLSTQSMHTGHFSNQL